MLHDEKANGSNIKLPVAFKGGSSLSLGFRGCRESEKVQMILSNKFNLKGKKRVKMLPWESREFCFKDRHTLALFQKEDRIKKFWICKQMKKWFGNILNDMRSDGIKWARKRLVLERKQCFCSEN